MAAQTVRDHVRLSTGRPVNSYTRRDPRGPKTRSASLMGAPAPSDHFTQARQPAGQEQGR
jgi:hypothetical protein